MTGLRASVRGLSFMNESMTARRTIAGSNSEVALRAMAGGGTGGAGLQAAAVSGAIDAP